MSSVPGTARHLVEFDEPSAPPEADTTAQDVENYFIEFDYDASMIATSIYEHVDDWTQTTETALRLGFLPAVVISILRELGASADDVVDGFVARADTASDVTVALDVVPVLARMDATAYAKAKQRMRQRLDKALNLNDLERAVKEVRDRKTPVAPAAAPTLPLSTAMRVIETGRRLRDVSDDCLTAIVAANSPPEVFVRGGQMSRVRPDEHGRPMIQAVTQAALKGHLERIADFETSDGSKSKLPDEVVSDLLALGLWPLPPLEGVVAYPVVRPDGTVLDHPGYDTATGLLYLPGPGLVIPAVAEHPTEVHVIGAKALLDDVFSDFPWADGASRANAYAALLSPVVRPATGRAPMALFDKPQQGTGATLLAEIITTIATGSTSPAFSAATDEAEWDRKIGAVLLSGMPVALIDNVDRPLDSASLGLVLTADTFGTRQIRSPDLLVLPHRAVWFATGNNIQVRGDIPRRVYWIRLDARTSRPWLRPDQTFRHPDLSAWVSERRGLLIWAALTLTRAWFAAGCPEARVPVLGKFEKWCRVVGGVLAHAGLDGFLSNIGVMYEEADRETAEWETFLSAWFDAYEDRPVTAAEISQATKVNTSLRTAIPDELAPAMDLGTFERALGTALGRKKDAVYGDFRLERAGEDKHAKVALWRVRRK